MQKPSNGTDRLDLLETFVRIVEAGSLSAAAQQQATTQPTISRRLQQLERLMGLHLLQRSTHVMKLTEDGERCYGHAKELLERWQAIEADLRGVQDEPRGKLRVLVPTVFGQQQLIPPLVQFLQQHPHVSVEWLLHDRMPDFIAEGIDCAIRIGSVDTPNLVAIRLAMLPRIVVAAPGIWGTGPAPADPAALASLPWLALSTFYRDEVVLHHAQSKETRHINIHPRLSTDHLRALCNAALSGLGVCHRIDMVGCGSAERRTAGAIGTGMDSAITADIAGVSPGEAASGTLEGVCAGDEGVFAGGGGGISGGRSESRLTPSRRAYVAIAVVVGALSAIAVGGLLTVVRPQSAGHPPLVREATANDSFTFCELELSPRCGLSIGLRFNGKFESSSIVRCDTPPASRRPKRPLGYLLLYVSLDADC